MTVATKKIRDAIGLRTGFWNRLLDSRNGTHIRSRGTAAMAVIPSSLLGTTLRIWNVGNRNHSGKISYGVAGSPTGVGAKVANPITAPEMAKTEMANM